MKIIDNRDWTSGVVITKDGWTTGDGAAITSCVKNPELKQLYFLENAEGEILTEKVFATEELAREYIAKHQLSDAGIREVSVLCKNRSFIMGNKTMTKHIDDIQVDKYEISLYLENDRLMIDVKDTSLPDDKPLIISNFYNLRDL
jgi:hypothetical protein